MTRHPVDLASYLTRTPPRRFSGDWAGSRFWWPLNPELTRLRVLRQFPQQSSAVPKACPLYTSAHCDQAEY